MAWRYDDGAEEAERQAREQTINTWVIEGRLIPEAVMVNSEVRCRYRVGEYRFEDKFDEPFPSKDFFARVALAVASLPKPSTVDTDVFDHQADAIQYMMHASQPRRRRPMIKGTFDDAGF